MQLIDSRDRLPFLTEQLNTCQRLRSQVRPDDPYRKMRLKSLNERINMLQTEIKAINPNLERYGGV